MSVTPMCKCTVPTVTCEERATLPTEEIALWLLAVAAKALWFGVPTVGGTGERCGSDDRQPPFT